jgi:hypothetical protein
MTFPGTFRSVILAAESSFSSLFCLPPAQIFIDLARREEQRQ